jgi:hypothetical protein
MLTLWWLYKLLGHRASAAASSREAGVSSNMLTLLLLTLLLLILRLLTLLLLTLLWPMLWRVTGAVG